MSAMNRCEVCAWTPAERAAKGCGANSSALCPFGIGRRQSTESNMVVMARVRVGERTFCTPSHSIAPSASVAATAAKFCELYLADKVVEFKFLNPTLVDAPPL